MARTEPEYDYFPQGRPGTPPPAPAPGRPLAQRGRPLQSLSPEDDAPEAPSVPGGRLSAPPPNVPPVFERPVQPRGDQRTWNTPGQGAGQGAGQVAGRPVPAFTAHTATPVRAAGRTLDGVPAQAGPAGAEMVPAPHGSSSVGSSNLGSSVGLQTWRAPSVRPPLPPATGEVTLGRRARRRPGRVAVASLLAALLTGAAAYGAVVGVPRYLEREDRVVWERTSVHVPRTVAGMPRVSTASANAQAKAAQSSLLGSGAGQMITDLAVYGGKAGTRVVVVVGRPQHPLEADERELVRAGFVRAVEASGVVLTERDPGDLGGWFGCGVHKGRTTMCLAVDAGAVVSVTVTATGSSAITIAREARAAVERRAAQ